MAKNIVRLNESQLRRMISESVRRVMNEMDMSIDCPLSPEACESMADYLMHHMDRFEQFVRCSKKRDDDEGYIKSYKFDGDVLGHEVHFSYERSLSYDDWNLEDSDGELIIDGKECFSESCEAVKDALKKICDSVEDYYDY